MSTHKSIIGLKRIDSDKRTMTFIASHQLPDGDGEVVKVSGIDLKRFRKNPVMLANHDRSFVVGKVTKTRVETVAGVPALVCEAEFLPAGSNPRVDEVWAEIQHGSRNGVSIGFMVHKTSSKKLHPEQTGLSLMETELLEISSVSIPACSTCLVTSKSACNCDNTVLVLDVPETPKEEIFYLLDDPEILVIDDEDFKRGMDSAIKQVIWDGLQETQMWMTGRLPEPYRPSKSSSHNTIVFASEAEHQQAVLRAAKSVAAQAVAQLTGRIH